MSDFVDITSLTGSVPAADDKVLLIRGQLALLCDALTYLLSAAERGALDTRGTGSALGTDNPVVAADQLAAHAANDGDAKHVTSAILAALSVYMGPDAVPSESNPFATMWTLWQTIVSAAGWVEFVDEADWDPYTVSASTPEWIGQVSRNTSTGTIWVGTATAGDAADWSRLETLLSGLTIAQITGLSDALAAKDTALAAHTGDTDNPHAVTAAQVGLGNCDNTSDADKPVSTAQAAAIAVEAARATAAEGVNAAAIAAEASARLAADLALLASQPTIRAITYSGGFSAFAASAARVGWLDYGGAVMLRVCAFGNGTLADMAPLLLSLTDSDGSAARVQVSLTLATGTLVMQTAARALPLSACRRLGVRVDAPSGGALSSASVAVHIEGETYTLANGGLEVVGTSYTGAPAAGTGAWTLCAASDGSNALSARVASEGWQAINYPLSVDDYALWFATGTLPHAGAGTMEDPDQPYVKLGGTGSISSASSSGFTVDAGAASMSAWKPTGYLSVMYGTPVTCNISLDAGVTAKVRLSDNFSMSNTVTLQEGINTVVLTAAKTSAVARLAFVEMSSVSGGTLAVSDFRVLGNTLAGLDLATQPVCTRTAGCEVLLHSESGVDGFDVPERMTLATQTDMTASGYLLGDRLVHPAGYVVDKVLVANKGSASATVTLRAGSSGGAVISTGTVAATGLPVALPLSSLSAMTLTGGKVYVTGGGSTSPLTITVILVRA